MPCFYPMIAYVDLQKSLDYHQVKFRFSNADPINASIYADMVKRGDITKYRNPAGITYRDSLIPCRQCVGCRLEYSRQWANRLLLELGVHDPSTCFFITLTYEEPPKNDHGFMTLVQQDMTDFIKRLRDRLSRSFPDLSFRYYYSGEYGDTTFHPHYHMICYDLKIPDLQLLKQTDNGPLFISRWLDSIWQKGYCFIASVSFEDCAYTARYVMKKLNGQRSQEYTAFGVQQEFARMSRRPGIGSQAFSIENFQKGVLKYVNGRPITVPSCWDRYMRGLDMDVLKQVKDSKSLLVAINNKQFQSSDYLPSQQLEIREKNLLDSIQKRKTF